MKGRHQRRRPTANPGYRKASFRRVPPSLSSPIGPGRHWHRPQPRCSSPPRYCRSPRLPCRALWLCRRHPRLLVSYFFPPGPLTTLSRHPPFHHHHHHRHHLLVPTPTPLRGRLWLQLCQRSRARSPAQGSPRRSRHRTRRG